MTIGIGSLAALFLGGAITAGVAITNAFSFLKEGSRIAAQEEVILPESPGYDVTPTPGETPEEALDIDLAPLSSETDISLYDDYEDYGRTDIDNNGNPPLDKQLTTKISEAALTAAGGSGVVADIENDIGRSRLYAYEVDITRSDRSEVTIYLSETLEVVKIVEDPVWD